MNLNSQLSFSFSTKGKTAILLSNFALVSSLLMLLLTLLASGFFFFRINRAESPDQDSGLLNQLNIQKATTLLKDQTVTFTPPSTPAPTPPPTPQETPLPSPLP